MTHSPPSLAWFPSLPPLGRQPLRRFLNGKTVLRRPGRVAIGEEPGKSARFPPSSYRDIRRAIITSSCHRTRKRCIFNHLNERSCFRYAPPLAFPTMSPMVPANKTENARPRSGRLSSWTKLPNRGVECRPAEDCRSPSGGQSGVHFRPVLRPRRAAVVVTFLPGSMHPAPRMACGGKSHSVRLREETFINLS